MDKELGRMVEAARKDVGMDQPELGALMGLKKQQVSSIESGERKLSAEELLTLTIIFQDWFEFRVEDLIEGLTADLSARLKDFLATVTFKPEQVRKRDWFNRLNCRLDALYDPTIT